MPSLSSTHHAPFDNESVPPVVVEYPALIVDEIDEDFFLPGALPEGSTRPAIATRLVRLPVEDISQVAVLSWRWDGDLQGLGSRNISSAIRVSKQRGIPYLFVDIISIDQRLDEDALIQQVTAFSNLYRSIPVIAAYDKEGEDFAKIVRRPWILTEARLFRYNPTEIIYVGHNDQGAKYSPYSPLQTPLLGLKLWRFRFGEHLDLGFELCPSDSPRPLQ